MAGELEPRKENWLTSSRDYFDEIRSEMKRVTWPTREQVQSTTGVVILCVFAFAAYFKVVDKVIESTVSKVQTTLSNPSR